MDFQLQIDEDISIAMAQFRSFRVMKKSRCVVPKLINCLGKSTSYLWKARFDILIEMVRI